MSHIKNYLKTLSELPRMPEAQKGFYRFLLDKGQLFTERIDVEIDIPIKMRGCHVNSAKYALYEEAELYSGFYAVNPLPELPFEHSFNMRDNQLIDVTSQTFEFDVQEWYGVSIPLDVLIEFSNEDTPDNLTLLEYYYLVHINN